MKGFGTDEKALIRTLSNKDPLQIEVLRNAFNRNFKRDLIKDIKSETSSWFEYGLVQLARGPLSADVHNLYEAMSGPGTKELVLNDILLSRSNADMKAIKSAYYQTYRKSLENDVKGDLSMKTERHFLMVLAATRAEDAAPVVPQQVDDDVMQIYKATEGKMGTDEILVCSILTSRNDNQIRAIAHSYKQKFNRDLEKVIKSVSRVAVISYAKMSWRLTVGRNSRATCRMRFSSSFETALTSTCTPQISSRSPWPAWAPRITSSCPVSSDSTGIGTSWPTSKAPTSKSIAGAWRAASRARRRATTRGSWWLALGNEAGRGRRLTR